MRPAAEAGHTFWQVKASTLCNLRCRYCYEWDRLADTRRLPLDGWRRVFEAARTYAPYCRARFGVVSEPLIFWHGGEPLLLPNGYVREVLALQREVFGAPPINLVQTNLFRPNETLETMLAAGFVFSVSLDGRPGARVDGAGRDSERQVWGNLAALQARGATVGVALVLGRHNYRDLPALHDALATLGVAWLRVNPLFAPPHDAPAGDLPLTSAEIVAALGELQVHRRRTGASLEVQPLDRIAEAVARHEAGEAAPLYARAGHAAGRFVVHPDGTLATQAGDNDGEHVIGNLMRQDLPAILAGDAYARAVALDDKARAMVCGRCRFQYACNGRALLETPIASANDPCPIEAPLTEVIAAQADGTTG
ncbi:MAG: radical SAM protein [Alphaproteobacteria bacterium]